MELEVKRPDHIVPSYSLTGDLLSYERCRLQYRYHNGSSLPPSRPVQMWFGEFLHGTLELAYRFWADRQNKEKYPFPWPCTVREWRKPIPLWDENDIGRFANLTEEALTRQGKQARSAAVRQSGYIRVELAINQIAPYLFPLIASAEKAVIGTRPVPHSDLDLRCNQYEVHGVIDVLTNLTLGQADSTNLIKQFVQEICPDLDGEYEVIVDYKGSLRPHTNDPYWEHGEWQVQTYAWLRSRQPDALPVAAGILIYINELTPGDEEMRSLRKGIALGTTDVLPDSKSHDEAIIRNWSNGQSTDQLSMEFRLKRALRVIPITDESTHSALGAFDNVVRRTEEDIAKEATSGNILDSWAPNCSNEGTCNACDFRHFCPQPAGKNETYLPTSPSAP